MEGQHTAAEGDQSTELRVRLHDAVIASVAEHLIGEARSVGRILDTLRAELGAALNGPETAELQIVATLIGLLERQNEVMQDTALLITSTNGASA